MGFLSRHVFGRRRHGSDGVFLAIV
jgi:hypothetical protein